MPRKFNEERMVFFKIGTEQLEIHMQKNETIPLIHTI